jgi:heme/flavin dehydrogenase (mycofactocin system)
MRSPTLHRMVNAWFDSVAVAQRRAERLLPKTVYQQLVAGTGRGHTTSDNQAAFAELEIKPITAGQPTARDMSTEVMGQPISMPVLISPTGVLAVRPDGEVAVARAAANRGVAMGLSSFGSKPIEEVVAANPQTFFQIYWAGDKDSMVARMERAKAAGAVGLIVTLDWSFLHGRDWGAPKLPQDMRLRSLVAHIPEAVVRPRWLFEWAKTGGPPSIGVPNFALPGERVPDFFEAYGVWAGTPPPTWDDIAWLRSQWDGPFMVKGIMRVDEAKRAVGAGATAISVSNHGGNNLDGTPASIRVLPGIVEAVGGDVEVVLDGGIRRGSDVVKSVALGAKAVMIGRAYLWGLAANGQAGVENVLDILRDAIDANLRGLGKSSIHELSPSDLIIPPGFER